MPTQFFVLTERDYTDLNSIGGGVVLIAVHHPISGCIRRCYVELDNKCVWIEISVDDGFDLPVGIIIFHLNLIMNQLKIT
jgi:hypothetical protein